MIKVDDFNQSDIVRLGTIPKAFRGYSLIFLILCVPVSFLFGLLGLTKKGHGYWITTLGLLASFACFTVWLILKEYFLYYQDKTLKKKYTGFITVTGKSKKKNDNVIFTDAPELKKVDLFDSILFEKISIGDELNIEISKFSKTLFKLSKDQTDLLEIY